VGTLGLLDGALMRWASTKALKIASAKSVWRVSIDRSSQSGSSRSRDSAQYHSPSSQAMRRQFQIDQRKRGIGPGSRSYQPLDPRRLLGLFDRRKTAARLANNFRHEIACHGRGVAKPVSS
jgi:hypothetical protein